MKKQSDNIDYSELIENYLDGELTESEKVLFEKRLTEDTVFANNFEIRKKLALLLKDAIEYQQTKEHVNEILNKKKYKNFYLRPVFAIAAGIIILIGLFFLLRENKTQEQESLISEMDTSVQVLQPNIEKIEPKANIEYFRPFSQVEPGSEVEIIPGIHKETYYSYKLKPEATIQPDLKFDNFYFYADYSISKGKYLYLNVSLIDGELYYKFKSIERNNVNLIIHADSLRINSPVYDN